MASSLWLAAGILLWLSASLSAQPPVAVRVQVPEGSGTSLGSGVLVGTLASGDGVVLTNNHVVHEGSGNTICHFLALGKRHKGRVIATDRVWDLAAINIGQPLPCDPVALADEIPQSGRSYTAGGFGGDWKWRAYRGRFLSRFTADNRTPDFFSFAGTARSGDSGGPIFDDFGALAGLLWGTGGGETMGTQLGRIEVFLTQYQVCPGGRCYPSQGSGGYSQPTRPQRPQPRPGDEYQAPVPDNSASAPTQPTKPNSDIARRLEKIEAALADLASRQPADAPNPVAEPIAGPPGPAGPKGDPGEKGESGTTPEVDYNALALQLQRIPLHVELLDKDGKIKQKTDAFLGGDPLRFQLVPIKVK